MPADLIRKAFRHWLGKGAVEPTPDDREAEFHLAYDDLHIGTLTHHDGQWTFEYTDGFRARQDLRPIANFPDVTRVYKSDELWPFFAFRIPSANSDAVQRIAERDHVDIRSEVEMLRRFGRRTIANPYELEPAR